MHSVALLERFTGVIRLMQGVLARFGLLRRMHGPLQVDTWNRLSLILLRVTGLLRRYEAGTLRTYPNRRPPCPSADRRHPARTRRPPAGPVLGPLPRRPGWLIAQVPEIAWEHATLRDWIADPKLAAIAAEVPQLRRALAPLCTMMGLRLPKRPPPRPTAGPPQPQSQPQPRPAPASAPALRPLRSPSRHRPPQAPSLPRATPRTA